jgi:DNA-binding response OmpR family regulator
VEDDPNLSRQLQKLLESESYTVDTASDGGLGLAMLEQYQYDVIVMDWKLPVMEGPELVRTYRAEGGLTPIIMLTAEAEIHQKETGFDAGADDYLTKPFNSRELSARLKALLRRAPVVPNNILKLAELTLDVEAHSAELAGVQLKLQKLEFCLLEFLMKNAGKVYTVETILERVWPADSEASIETVRGYIKTLRKKMLAVSEKPTIRNLHGQGYKLDAMESN